MAPEPRHTVEFTVIGRNATEIRERAFATANAYGATITRIDSEGQWVNTSTSGKSDGLVTHYLATVWAEA